MGLGGIVGVVEFGHPGPAGEKAPPQGGGDAAQSTALAHGDVAPRQGGRPVAELGAGAHGRDELGLIVAALQTDELAQGGAPDDRIDREPNVALKIGQGSRGEVTKDPVHPAGVEAETAEALLQVGHVVATLHGGAPVEEAVAQLKTRFHQGVPCLLPADSVDAQPPPALEGLYGGPGGGSEDPLFVEARPTGSESRKALLDVAYGSPAVADAQRQLYR